MAEGGQMVAGFCLREEEKVCAVAWAKQMRACWLVLVPSSQQMKLMDFGVLSLVGSSLPEVLGWLE